MFGHDGKCVIANTVCPENADPEKGKYCPCWLEVTEKNAENNEVRIRKDCSHRVLFDWMKQSVHANWTAAETVSKMRNEVAKRLNGGKKPEQLDAKT